MTRTVFDNSMVAHVWAQQSQEKGKSNNGNFWFKDCTIWSYRTAMATFLKPYHFAKKDSAVCFINRDRYSVSTSRHQSYIRQAVRGGNTLYVSRDLLQDLARVPRFFNSNRDKATRVHLIKKEYERNFERARRALEKAGRARSRSGEHIGVALSAYDDCVQLSVLFKVRVAVPKDLRHLVNGDIESMATEYAKQARLKAARDKQRQQQADREQFESWIAGGPTHCPRSFNTTPSGGVYMRRVEIMARDGSTEELQTSQGARVPWGHAVRVFKVLKAIRASGQAWQRNGKRLRVGHFEVDRIEASGDFKAGCHVFKWADIEPFAREQGVFSAMADMSGIEHKEST